MTDLGLQIARCWGRICNSKCKYYDTKKSCCNGLSKVFIQLEKTFLEHENYKDLEKQGKLLKLPCAVGDTVWYWDKELDPIEEAPFEGYVLGYEIGLSKTTYILIRQKLDFIPTWNDDSKCKLEIDDFGINIFLTKEDAEIALNELRKGRIMAEIKMDKSVLFYECPVCGSEVELGQSYCQECGEPLEWKEE